MEEVAGCVTVFLAGFPASRSQGRSGRACRAHGSDPLSCRQCPGGVPALRHGFTPCSQQIPPSACRSTCGWPEGGTGPAGSPLSLPCSTLPSQDICGAVSTGRDPAACAAYLPSARTGSGTSAQHSASVRLRRSPHGSCCQSAMMLSFDSMRDTAEASSSDLRVIGIDDWAWRKGQRYGTLFCDLERRRVIDLLPDREPATVEA